MTSNTKAWLASVGLGLLAGWTMQGLVVMGLPVLLGEASPALVPTMAVSPYVIMVGATLSLRRTRDMHHRLGWGLSVAGVGLLLTGLMLLLGVILPVNNADPSMSGAGVLLLLLTLPYAVSGVAMAAVGVVLLRRKPVTNPPISSPSGDR